jgi:repressor LexA
MGRTPAGETREKVFAFVRDRLLAGQPPTVREVQEALGFRAVRTAQQHLERLVEEGRLVAGRHRARGYRLPGSTPGARIVLAPLLGRVPAGALDEAIEDPDGYLPVDARGAAAGDLFALRVRGESMTGAGILSGDLVIVRRQPTAANGDVVVARVGDEATVKTFRSRGRQVELCPENPAFEPIMLDAGAVVILGKVIEVRRILDARGATDA